MQLIALASSIVTAAVIIIPDHLAAQSDTEGWLTNHAVDKSAARAMDKSNLAWYDGTLLTIEGRGFIDTVTSYSRLAHRHQSKVPGGVWNNGQSAAGVTIRFVTDSSKISAAWGEAKPAMPHMAWSGSGGLDLYARVNDKWEFQGAGNPTSTSSVAQVLKVPNVNKLPKEYMLFLPLYSTTTRVELGLDPDAKLSRAPDRYEGQLPIVFYGTSITQGGCASRAGMSHVGILRRMLDYPIVNLGFSGSGKGELVMVDILAEVPAALYVIENVQNMSVEETRDRTLPLIKKLRSNRPDTPILMVESPNMWSQREKHVHWRNAYEQLKGEGMENLHYLRGDDMYSSVEEGTVDRVHPTDLGFYTMALAYEPVLRDLLNEVQAESTSTATRK